MLGIQESTKLKLKSDNCDKDIIVEIENNIIGSEYIYKNSLSLTEQIISSNLEITGCISTMIKIKINTLSGLTKKNYQGTPIKVKIKIDNEVIPLFTGYVDTVEKDNDKTWQTFTCYDALYFLGSINIYNWYNNKYSDFPSFTSKSITLKTFRDNLFFYCKMNGISIEQVDTELPNDSMKIKKRFKNKDMTLIDALRGICQINGCFGIINRDGIFEYRFIEKGSSGETVGAYPSLFYPSQVYPSQPVSGIGRDGEYVPESINTYESLTYSDDLVNPIYNGITMRNNSDDAGVTWASEQGASIDWDDDTTDDALIDDETEITAGTYILDSNMFAYRIKKSNKKKAIANIYAKIGKDTYFRNYEAKVNGLPYLECGDKVVFVKTDGTPIEFIITKRVLSGDQRLTDVYSADCIEKKSEYFATGQGTVSTTSKSLSTDEVTDIATEVTNTSLGGDGGQTNDGYLYVVSFENGVLSTKSGVPNG